MLQENVRLAAQQPWVKRDILRSVTDLQAAINRLLAEHNGQAIRLDRRPGQTVAAIRRGHQALDSIH